TRHSLNGHGCSRRVDGDMPLVFYCTRRHLLAVDPSVAGKRVRCPVCNEVMIAPVASAPASEPTPPPAPVSPPPPPSPVPADPPTSTSIAAGAPPIPQMEIPSPAPPPMVLPVVEDPSPPPIPMATVAPPIAAGPDMDVVPMGPSPEHYREPVPTDE